MMTPLARLCLEADVAVKALVEVLGRSKRAAGVRMHLKALRLAIGRLLLAELATRPNQMEPEAAVRMVTQTAIQAGLDWQTVAAIFNGESERRPSA